MPKQLLIQLNTAVLCFSLVSPLTGQTLKNARPLTAAKGDHWKIRWDRSDDFNADDVDWRKWNKSPEIFGAWTWGNERNTSVANGILTITMRRDRRPDEGTGRRPTPYKSGMLKSYAKGTYEYYEVRLKAAPLFPGVCPSFWLYSPIDDKLVDPGAVRYSEVDVVELTQRGDRVPGNERVADLNLHAILSNGKVGLAGRDWLRPNDERYRESQANEYITPFDPREEFHTYGCYVSKESITWYVDGTEIGQKKNEHWHRKMNVALSLGLRPPYSKYTPRGFVPVTDQPSDGFPTEILSTMFEFGNARSEICFAGCRSGGDMPQSENEAPKLHRLHRPTHFHQAPLECGGVFARSRKRYFA